MPCAGCQRRKEKLKRLWAKIQNKVAPTPKSTETVANKEKKP